MLVPLMLALLSAASGGVDGGSADARLNDLCFVDARRGWAVGDRGVILSTTDGGQSWQPQNSGVPHALNAVSFVDEQVGWAAGGFTHPYTHTSTGFVLSTRDGGQTWTAGPTLLLPALRRMAFWDSQHGWAIGSPSAMYPGGVFVTDDGGRRWQPVPGGRSAEWLAADFVDPRTGALAGRGEALAVVRQDRMESTPSDPFGLRNWTQLRLARASYGWLAGDAGTVLMTEDLGTSWHAPPSALPPAMQQFDFAAMAVRGPKCWIAGSPGTRVFHSPDAGRTWLSFVTGTTAPLRALWFSDDEHGWAAGALGTILATDDGGRSWRRQRAGGERAALLALIAEPEDAPLELIAKLGGNDGYLAVVEAIGRRDIEIPPRSVPSAERLHEAVVRVGGSAADAARGFPLRQRGWQASAEQIVEAWNRVHQGRAEEALQAHLVRQIRLWQPDVVFTHDAPNSPAADGGARIGPESRSDSKGPSHDEPFDHEDEALVALVHRAVLQAVNMAADPSAFPTQITDAGLAPWTVKKVFGATPPGVRGPNDLTTIQFAPRLGRSLADAATEPRGLLRDRFSLAPSTLGFRPLLNAAPASQDRRDFFGGIVLAPGGPARRETPQSVGADLDVRERISQTRRHIQGILDQADRATGSSEQWLAQIDNLTRDLDDDSRGQILYQLADRYDRTGHWPLAAETFEVLVERHPQHAFAPQAMLWLVQYCASSEAAWRVDRNDGKKRFERAIALGRQIEQTRPEWFAEPAVCFPLAAAYRGLGQTKQVERLYRVQSHGGDRDAWTACAQAELAADGAKQRQLKPTLACVKADAPPHLDGELDDAVWQQAKSAPLESAQHDDGDWPAAVQLAYDAEFLYVAVQCRSPTAPATMSETAQRPRDGDLTDHDRVEVFLDIDRDYAVYDRLAIDDRGWANDRCWRDPTWNPQWFVAAKRTQEGWRAEAAVPLAELTGRSPQPHDVWAIGMQRVLPGVGFQSWSTPAAISVLPDGFGYLVFQ